MKLPKSPELPKLKLKEPLMSTDDTDKKLRFDSQI